MGTRISYTSETILWKYFPNPTPKPTNQASSIYLHDGSQSDLVKMIDHITNLPHCHHPCPSPSTGSLLSSHPRPLCLLILLPGALLHQIHAWLTLVCPSGSNGTFSKRLPPTAGSKITTSSCTPTSYPIPFPCFISLHISCLF